MREKKKKEERKKEERADRNRSPSTVARTGPFCCSRAWKPLTPTKNANKDERKVQFPSLMDFCHLKLAELPKSIQKYTRRLVLRRDNVNDDEGYQAVLSEQGARALQMAAARFLDTAARLPGISDKPTMPCQHVHERCTPSSQPSRK